MSWVQLIVTVICAVLASSGFWALVTRKLSYKDNGLKLLMGLAHDRIMDISQEYLDKGSITDLEYEDLEKYLYDPYLELGGNGRAKYRMKELEKIRVPTRTAVNVEKERVEYEL